MTLNTPDGELSQFLSCTTERGARSDHHRACPRQSRVRDTGSGYFQYFNSELARYGWRATNPRRGFYSFNLGNWHIVALNTNCSDSGIDCVLIEKTWLEADLQADDHTCELAIAHHATLAGPGSWQA